LLDLVACGFPFRHRSRQISPGEAKVIHDGPGSTPVSLGFTEKDHDTGELYHLESLIRDGNAAHQGPKLLVHVNVADV
jgi:hypothetical protein